MAAKTKKKAVQVPALVVDRDGFVAWTQGIIFERRGNHLVIGDSMENVRAEKLLKKGETVMLTRGGVPFSTVTLDRKKNEFIEKLL